MVPIERPDILTPCSVLDMAKAMQAAALDTIGTDIPDDELVVLLGHSFFETGGWQKMHGNNLGNAKSVPGDGHDFAFYECGEEFTFAHAELLMQGSPLVSLVRRYTLDGVAMASVIVRPKHPICRFRSFESLKDGVEDHLVMLVHRFPEAWAALPAGPAAFVHGLRQGGYFTLDETTYLTRMLPCVEKVRAELFAAGFLGGDPAPENDTPNPGDDVAPAGMSGTERTR